MTVVHCQRCERPKQAGRWCECFSDSEIALLEAVEPFTRHQSSEETFTISVRRRDVENARRAVAKAMTERLVERESRLAGK
jgi:NMD protein affecting ribosome stability and mRNA decay